VTIWLQVQAVDSIKKYHKLEDYLRELSAVAQVRPLEVDGQNATFEVTLRSNEDEFFNLIKNDDKLIEAKPVEIQPVEAQKNEPVLPENNLPATPNAAAGLDKNAAVVAGGITTAVVAATENGKTPDQVLSDQPLVDEPTGEPEPQTPVYYYRLKR